MARLEKGLQKKADDELEAEVEHCIKLQNLGITGGKLEDELVKFIKNKGASDFDTYDYSPPPRKADSRAQQKKTDMCAKAADASDSKTKKRYDFKALMMNKEEDEDEDMEKIEIEEKEVEEEEEDEEDESEEEEEEEEKCSDEYSDVASDKGRGPKKLTDAEILTQIMNPNHGMEGFIGGSICFVSFYFEIAVKYIMFINA